MFNFALSLFLASFCLASVSPRARPIPEGTLHRRNYFYVGGSYTAQGNSSISGGQMYVEQLTPAKITAPFPLVIIHGRGMTGTNFLNTPDGRPGWADYFLSKGYEVFLVDQPARGRSAYQQDIDGPQSPFDTYTIEARFTATQNFNLWPQAVSHTQWPGNGTVGDPVFDEFYASMVTSVNSETDAGPKVRSAGAALLDKIGPAVIMTHSQSGQYGWIIADARPEKVVAIVAVEPVGPPFIQAIFAPIIPARAYGLTDIPIAYDPAVRSPEDIARVIVSSSTESNFTCYQQASPARKLVNLEKTPVLVVTSESGYHSIYDDCSVDYLRMAGVSVEHVKLGEAGIHGNGHMMFMEKNSHEIVDQVVQKWITKTVH